jgi:ketopantoate reductase
MTGGPNGHSYSQPQRAGSKRKVGVLKTSMSHDLERSRPMEINLLLTMIHEMGRLGILATAAIDTPLARADSPDVFE